MEITINLSPQLHPQTTTFNESFTPKSKLFNKTVFKKHGEVMWRGVENGYSVLYECTALTS